MFALLLFFNNSTTNAPICLYHCTIHCAVGQFAAIVYN